MSDTMLRGSAMALLVAASLAVPLPASAQDAADRAGRMAALAARVDSLNAEYTRHELDRLHDELRPSDTMTIALDTTRIGPLLLLAPAGTDVSDAALALETVWSEYARVVGRASVRLDDLIVTRAMPPDEMRVLRSRSLHLLNPYEPGRRGRVRAAQIVMAKVLTARVPGVMKDWLGVGSVSIDARLEDAYRTLALMSDDPSQECLAANVSACLDAIGHDRPARDHNSVVNLRTSLLAYALQRGGDDAYARLFTDSTSIDAQLTNAAQVPLDRLVADWSADIRRARPNIRADVARSGLWTLTWLVLLAMFATRSTRWRLG